MTSNTKEDSAFQLYTLDELWDQQGGVPGFLVLYEGDVFKSPKKVTGKTGLDNKLYDANLYWVGGRLICRRDCSKRIWRLVKRTTDFYGE